MRMHGLLFTSDFLREGIRHTRGWMDAETEFLAFREAIGRLVAELGDDVSFNATQTEDEVIVPVLAALGWTDFIRQAPTSQSGRPDVPDVLLFAPTEATRPARRERNASPRHPPNHDPV